MRLHAIARASAKNPWRGPECCAVALSASSPRQRTARSQKQAPASAAGEARGSSGSALRILTFILILARTARPCRNLALQAAKRSFTLSGASAAIMQPRQIEQKAFVWPMNAACRPLALPLSRCIRHPHAHVQSRWLRLQLFLDATPGTTSRNVPRQLASHSGGRDRAKGHHAARWPIRLQQHDCDDILPLFRHLPLAQTTVEHPQHAIPRRWS
ncbi:hypothetical protein ERJ75_001503400 [Trypanosoma vivax]|nr:hypothetical protein ERJ75_001503400 [Trypanosoma vivax]